MDKNLQQIFEAMNIFFTEDEAQQYFLDAKILDKIFSKSKNELRIFIQVNDFLPSHILQKLEFGLLSDTNRLKAKLNLCVLNKNYTQELICQYIDYIRDNKAEFKTGTILGLNNKTILFDKQTNTVEFSVTSDTEGDLLKQHVLYYQDKLVKYGFENISVKVSVNKNHNEPDIVELYQEKLIEQATIVQANQAVQKSVPKTTNQNYGTKFYARKKDLSRPDYQKLSDLDSNAVNVIVHGELIKLEMRVAKSNRKVYTIGITDGSSSIKAVYFQRGEEITLFDKHDELTKEFFARVENEQIKLGDWVALCGDYSYSDWDKHNVFKINAYQKLEQVVNERQDTAPVKRVELHTHSKMSVMDGVSSVQEYLSTAKAWGWKAIALTDHLNVQAFPDAYYKVSALNKNVPEAEKLKLIYGTEVEVLPNDYWVVKNPKNQPLRQAKFVVYDLETTGLSPELDEIIEFGANIYDYASGKSSKIDILIKPKKPVSEFTTNLTGISNEMLEDKKSIEEEFARIYEVIKDGILVAHNANFDFNFLDVLVQRMGYPPLTNTVIDTLTMSRILLPNLKFYRLGSVAWHYYVDYNSNEAHRADYDAEVLTSLFERLWNDAKAITQIDLDSDFMKLSELQKDVDQNFKRMRGAHTQLLVKNQAGLKDLYKVISFSHTKNFMKSPKIFERELNRINKNKNLLVGSGCANGIIFETARTGTFKTLREEIKKLDFVEVQPPSVYENLVARGSIESDQVEEFIKTIIKIAKEENVLVVATSDAHYVDPKQKKIRDVYIYAKGLGGISHPLHNYKNPTMGGPDQHLRTTTEMLSDFSFLEDQKLIEEIVITNTLKIADQIEMDVKPLKEGLYTPKIENADQQLKAECYKNAYELYGEKLPPVVEQRLEKELNSIIKHGFAVVYWICHLLVKKSFEDGYLVGSRGSVGSSLVATLSKITEVNPLVPHYRCEKCKFSDFEINENVKCGFDLPSKPCPQCQHQLVGDGHNIPFETFLGFDGDKIPDIDLNFSGEYQSTAHDFTKKMFGENNVFRAGTISTVADKTAFGYVKGYFDAHGEYDVPKMEIERLAEQVTGVKRTTGQHPGGIIILPEEYEIEDFTPVNYPADDTTSNWLTTHFDFNSIHDNLLKMDILGHVDPTALKMLQDYTGVDPQKIPVNDEKVYQLFSNLNSLQIKSSDLLDETTGAIGLPEFGTSFVRNMLKETQPKNFADLVQLSGLSHGTDVYTGNAQDLIKNNVVDLGSVIGCRDDIMGYLINKGIDPSTSFKIMEKIRKGQGLEPDLIEIMKEHNVPDWYIQSCLKIKYLFPKAHATAYVLMAYRVGWYKVYYPEEYYAVWFSTRAKHFDIETICGGESVIRQKYLDITRRMQANEDVSTKEKELLGVYEVALEMYLRNINIKNIDVNISEASRFIIRTENNKKIIYIPFNTVDSLGDAAAKSIVAAREEKLIASIKDLVQRTQITKTQLEIFKKFKILDDLKEDEQLTFDF